MIKNFIESHSIRKSMIIAFIAIFFISGALLIYNALAASNDSVVLVPNHIYPEWEASEKKKKAVKYIDKVKKEIPVERSLRLKRMKLGVDDILKPTFNINGSTVETDFYKPVKFMMKEHALRENLDCAVCHHKTPDIQAPDEQAARSMETTRCESCHQGTGIVEKVEDRLSLKAAYHQKCIECHKEKGGKNARIYCNSCHRQNVVSHEKMFTVVGDPEKVTPTQMTRLCLDCHSKAGEEMVKSAHYKWGGPVSKWTVTQNDNPVTGKVFNSINNNCISPYGDWGHCTKCHVGYGSIEDEGKEFSKNPENIDCLVCHAEEDTYGKGKYGMPAEDVDLVWAAGLVGNT
ncbi:MAG: hypothetical protein HN931_09965, partial [Desulfobacterales bacterium]|nr:hypothetical protein [Desulfobacterales bacterium]